MFAPRDQMSAPLTLKRIVKPVCPSLPASVVGSVSFPVTSVKTRNPMRRASALATAPPASVNATLKLYRVCVPTLKGVWAGHHSLMAFSAAASVTVTLDAPAGSATGTVAVAPHAPATVSEPVVAAGAAKCTTTSTEKSPCAPSASGAVGYAPL